MAKLVKLTSNIDLDLPASKFDLRPWKMWRWTYIYFLFWAFWCIKRWNRLKMAKIVKLTSNIDLDLPASKFDLRSWKIWRETYIYFWFWAFWCIERWNRLKNGQVSEIDLQYWPWPPSFQVWPPILKSVQWNLHLFLIFSILVYWTLKSVKKWPS